MRTTIFIDMILSYTSIVLQTLKMLHVIFQALWIVLILNGILCCIKEVPFDLLKRSNPESVELCIVNTPSYHHRWNDFIGKLLMQAAELNFVLRLVASNDTAFAARECSCIVSPLAAKLSTDSIKGLMYHKATNRFAYLVLVAFDDLPNGAILQHYRVFVRAHRILNSLLLLHGCLYSHNLLLDQTIIKNEGDISDIIERDKFNQVYGWPFKIDKPDSMKHLFHAKQILKGKYYMLLKTFAVSTNASFQWVSLKPISPDINWYIRNKIDIIVNVPFKASTMIEYIPEHNLQGFCLLVPEAFIGPYVHHLLNPFQTALWILILLVIASVIAFNIKFQD